MLVMNAVEKIQAKLTGHPEISYQVSNGGIIVHPATPTGFTVGLTERGGEYVVHFDGWHQVFTSEAEALNCFAFGLSRACRLKVYRRGGRAHKWTVESQRNGAWVPDSTTGLLIFAFWLKEEVVYLQNDLVAAG